MLLPGGINKKTNKILEEERQALKLDLDRKVENFIEWYYQNMVKGNYTAIGEYLEPRELKNFIEKMAVWYELRYPEYEINRLMPGSSQEFTHVDEVMFENNKYVKDLLDEESLINCFSWSDFYNMHAFFQSLPGEEKWYLERPKYNNLVYINYKRNARVYISNKGFVVDDCDCRIINYNFNDYSSIVIPEQLGADGRYVGKHITELKSLALQDGFITEEDIISGNCEIDKAIDIYNKRVYFKENLLDAVMYRIIERGGNRFGPRRGFLFAKEFKRNIDIPMMYAVDTSDPGLRLFMNEYLKLGGKKDLVCYENYFRRPSKKEKMNTVSIQELILTNNHNAATFYTPEEDMLHEKLATLLATQIDYEEINKNKAKALRIERKLEKSRNNK